jgi:DNA repair exonuclease SbcCD nuclease subunit
VHNFAVISQDPLVVFPGNLQGRSIRETGPKGGCIVTFEDRHPTIERLFKDVVQWEHVQLDVSNLKDIDDCLDRCRDELLRVVESGSEVYAMRVEFSGATIANQSLRAKREQLSAEVRILANNLGGAEVWIEKVVVSTTSPKERMEFTGDGVAGEIGRVLIDLQEDLPSLAGTETPRLPELSNLRSQLRAARSGSIDALSDEELGEGLRDAAEMLAALLGGEETFDAD